MTEPDNIIFRIKGKKFHYIFDMELIMVIITFFEVKNKTNNSLWSYLIYMDLK
ncbi:hypothetical protein Xenpb_02426 [Xenorhabdus sp. PB62.4]|nr:hypothetical protein [Xenorhabdus sp. PB62.4]